MKYFPFLFLLACSTAKPRYSETRAACSDHDPLKKAFFGELHSHTSYSFDAWTYGLRSKPADAYAFAQGQPATLPAPAAGGAPVAVQLDRPLDFAAVTDHSEYLGETSLCSTPGSAAYDSMTCQEYRTGDFIPLGTGSIPPNPVRADFCGSDGAACKSAAAPVWQDIQDAAEAAYDRTADCRFTSFVAYEYSLSPLGSNMHRNVIFRNAHALPAPLSMYEAPEPQDLWAQLKKQCREAGTGCDVIAIPHNSNASNGLMFRTEYEDATTVDQQRQQARLRAEMEPLVEIMQHKGDSECINGLPEVAGAPDELCDFEKIQQPPLDDCGPDRTGAAGLAQMGCVSWRDFVRNALKLGLSEQLRLGVNPFKLGIIASTDTHSATPGHVDETHFTGHTGNLDDGPDGALATTTTIGNRALDNPGGLAGVWAEENSRDSIFDALKRRETFGTSGPRIAVRFFGGWNYDAGLCGDAELVQKGYAGGVPMGGDLSHPPPSSAGGAAPRFVVAAMADGGGLATPLQRVQIVKGWVDGDGNLQEQVFEVAGDANSGATVDVNTCQTSGGGSTSLCAVFTDPAFDATRPAFYYARAVENPTCRWSTFLCNSLSAGDQTRLGCDRLGVPKTIQERAWSSPIWYTP
jgi:hypothetical protein